MLSEPLSTYLLFDFEPSLDTAHSGLSLKTLKQADRVISFTAFVSEDLLEISDVLLPLASNPQTDGSYTNLDGITQSFEAAVAPSGEAKPGWKILRRLGEELGLAGFDFIDRAAIDTEMSQNADRSKMPVGHFEPSKQSPWGNHQSLTRIGDVPIYHTDGLVRRSKPMLLPIWLGSPIHEFRSMRCGYRAHKHRSAVLVLLMERFRSKEVHHD